jgi:hypothetical protein
MHTRRLSVFGLQVACLATYYFADKLAVAATCTGVTSIADGNGPVLTQPEVSLSFWGSYWTMAPSLSAGAIAGAAQDIVNGPYLSLLNQYRNAGLARLVPGVNVYTGTQPPASFHNSDVVSMLQAQMTSGAVPPPVTNPTNGSANNLADMVYVVFMPKGSVNPDYGNRTTGFHGTDRYLDQRTRNEIQFVWAWVIDDGSLTDQLSSPISFSHELAEAITDPFFSAFQSPVTCEIGDMCVTKTQVQNGHSVQSYWSNADRQCVLPTGWTGIFQYNGGTSWPQISNKSVRQIYSGQFGLIATDTNDNVSLYSGTPLNWSQIGGPGAMFAVGQGTILRLSNDESSVSAYNGSSWPVVGGAATAVYGDGPLLATDPGGNLWQYFPASNSWSNGPIAGKADQFVTDAVQIFALAWDHGSVWRYNSGTSWTAIGGPADQLFAGGPVSGRLAATTLDPNRSVFLNTEGAGWLSQGGAGYMFAVTGGPGAETLSAMTPSRSGGVWTSSNVNMANPPWNQIGGPAGRLIAGYNALYATAGIDYVKL